MKRYAFPLPIILLLFAVIALAAPGDKRPAVTSAAIGLGTSSSATMASITATTSVTAPAYNSTAADGYHYIMPYNSIAFAGTPLAGMFVTTPTGPQWYTGSAWEAVGSGGGGTWGSITGTLSAQTDLQAALDAISAGGITMSTAIPSTPGSAYLNDSTHVLTVASSTGYTQFTGSYTAWDTTPDAFAFTDETSIALNTAKTSNAITVAGTNYPSAISVTGDTGFGYSKNSAACTATSGTVVAGDTVAACVTSSGSNSTATTATVTIGGVSDTYSVTTAAGSASAMDAFVYANGNLPLTDWALVYYAVNPVVASETLTPSNTTNYQGAYYLGSYSGAQYSQLQVASVSDGCGGPSVWIPQANSGRSYYAKISTNSIQVRKFEDDSGDYLIGTELATVTASGDYVRIETSGSGPVTLTVKKSSNGTDWSTVGTVTDSSGYYPSSAGNPGIRWPLGAATSCAVDNWSGGAL